MHKTPSKSLARTPQRSPFQKLNPNARNVQRSSKKVARSLGTPASKKFAALSTPAATKQHICKLCGVGPLASAVQLDEHRQGKKHQHRLQKLQRMKKWTPSKNARMRALKQSTHAWKVSPMQAKESQSKSSEPQQTVCPPQLEQINLAAPKSHQSSKVESTAAVDDSDTLQQTGDTEVSVSICHAIVAKTGKPCTLKAKANGRCGRHKAAKFAR